MSELTPLNTSTGLDEATLNNLQTVDEALAALGVADQNELSFESSPWQVVDKSALVGRAFLAVQWQFRESKEYPGSEFVSVYIITQDKINGQDHFVLNDGSTGICAQLRGLTNSRNSRGQKNPQAGALVRGGLKLSEYDRTDASGVVIGKGKTYYLSN